VVSSTRLRVQVGLNLSLAKAAAALARRISQVLANSCLVGSDPPLLVRGPCCLVGVASQCAYVRQRIETLCLAQRKVETRLRCG
jgi:hypothetical protein